MKKKRIMRKRKRRKKSRYREEILANTPPRPMPYLDLPRVDHLPVAAVTDTAGLKLVLTMDTANTEAGALMVNLHLLRLHRCVSHRHVYPVAVVEWINIHIHILILVNV